jgi:GNAT superfamily N-acetyltransferase
MAHSPLAAEALATVHIRRAAVSDAADIARLSVQFGHPVLVTEVVARIAALAEMPSQFLAVAEVSAAGLLGWIQVERRLVLAAGARAEIVGLVVDASARRRGVATLLANAAQLWAGDADVAQIVVRSNVARDASHAFYLALGYSRIKTQHVYAKSVTRSATALRR